jgi:NSS family neurotransmitter:Na+ symporter
LFDFASSNILLPLGGLAIAIFVGYSVKKTDVGRELSNQGILKTSRIVDVFFLILRYITPILLILVFLYYTGLTKLLFNF